MLKLKSQSNENNSGYKIYIVLFICLSVIAVYAQVFNHDFINFDDNEYVYDNKYVINGITKDGLSRVFRFSTNGERNYYHPLTTLSHMLDCQLFGLSPGWHHLTNLLLHLLNVILLFIVLFFLTRKIWQSAFVVALFALHPLNVESIAWVAERKNLLSTFFWFLTILLYIRYVRKPSVKWFIAVFFSMLLGLFAKPTLITLPFVLMLLDFWPLGRITYRDSGFSLSQNYHLIAEKIPLLFLSMAWTYLSIHSNQRLGIMVSNITVSMDLRIANALISYVKYIGKMLWPFNLSIFYPYPTQMPPVWQIIVASVVLSSATIYVVKKRKIFPWLLVGWFWYLGNLFPMIGIAQNGLWPEMADRWAYIPSIGIYIMIAWGVSTIFRSRKIVARAIPVFACVFFIVISVISYVQTSFWKNSITLFEHVIKATKKNVVAYNNLANALIIKKESDLRVPMAYLQKAIELDPSFINSYSNYALCLYKQQRYKEAISYFLKVININENDANLHCLLGMSLLELNNIPQAIYHITKAKQLNPDSFEIVINLALAYEKAGKLIDAIGMYKEALQFKPLSQEIYTHLGRCLKGLGKYKDALDYTKQALAINPEYAEAHNTIGNIYQSMGQEELAITHFKKAIQFKPDLSEAYNNYGAILLKKRHLDEAISNFEIALQKNPDLVVVQKNLGDAFFLKGNFAKAISCYQNVLQKKPNLSNTQQLLNEAYRLKEQLEIQIQDLEKRLRGTAEDAKIYFELGRLFRQTGRSEEALHHFRKAMDLNPGLVQALNSIIFILTEKGDYQEAIDVYKGYLKMYPRKVNIYYNIACLYARKNKIAESVQWLHQAIDQGYSNWEHIRTDRDMEIVRNSSEYKKMAIKFHELRK
jgi:protein O-mannosyl-transferase